MTAAEHMAKLARDLSALELMSYFQVWDNVEHIVLVGDMFDISENHVRYHVAGHNTGWAD